MTLTRIRYIFGCRPGFVRNVVLTHNRIHTAQTLVWVHRASTSCIQAVEDAHSASSDVTSAGLRGKFGAELQYIMQHTACSRQRRDMWVGSLFLVWNASSPIIIKTTENVCLFFSQILPQVPLYFLLLTSCEKDTALPWVQSDTSECEVDST